MTDSPKNLVTLGIDTLMRALNDRSASPSAIVEAAEFVLEREYGAHGLPKSPSSIPNGDSQAALSALEAIVSITDPLDRSVSAVKAAKLLVMYGKQ